MKFRILLLVPALLLGTSLPVLRAQVRSYESPAGLINAIDPVSGAATAPAEYNTCNSTPRNVLFSTNFTSGFAYCPSESASEQDLYGLEWEGGSGPNIFLYKMGATFGCAVGERVGAQPVGGTNLESLAYCTADGFFYSASFNFGTHLGRLVRINRQTGVGTPIGDPLPRDVRIVGLTYDPTSGMLLGVTSAFGALDAQLWKIDPATANATLVGPTGTAPNTIESLTLADTSQIQLAVADLPLSSVGGSTVLIGGGTTLYGLDPNTGTATAIGGSYGGKQFAMAAPQPDSQGTEEYFPQAVRGDAENTTRILIWNTSASSTSATVEFFNSSGTLLETQTRAVGVDATVEVILGGPVVALTVGWVRVTSSGTVQVTAFLRLAGVPQVGVLPVTGAAQWNGVGEVNDVARTGVAAANPGDGASSCTLTAYNTSGVMAGEKDIALGPGDQTAMFLDELIPGLPTPYEGCFSLTCVGGNVVSVALRQRLSDAAFTTVAMDKTPGSTEVYFPQAVQGDAQNTTKILVWNSGTTSASVTVRFFNQDGVNQETQNRTVAAKATKEVVLEGAGLTVGSVKVTSNVAVLATAFFSILGGPEVGVLPVTGAGWWAGVGEVSAVAKTGLAAANAGLGTASCTLTAYNASGTMAGEAPIALGRSSLIDRAGS